jgi:hypothetical protein
VMINLLYYVVLQQIIGLGKLKRPADNVHLQSCRENMHQYETLMLLAKS